MGLAKFIGIPYEHKGRGYESIDCWGLVELFYKEEFGIALPSYVDYYAAKFNAADVSQAIDDGVKQHGWVPTNEFDYGTVLTFRIMGAVSHCGVHIGGGDFIHAFHGCDTCVESVSDITWSKRLGGMYEWVTKH